MTDPGRAGQSSQARQSSEPTQPQGNRYQPYTDPAYSWQLPYSPRYGSAGPTPPLKQLNPTQRLPQYWLEGQPPPEWQQGQPLLGEPPQGGTSPQGGPSPPGRSKPPRWLWIVAIAAVVLVIGLVVALVVANGSAKKETAVPPLPAMPNSKAPASTTTSPSPAPTTSTPPRTTTSAPSTTTQPSNAGAAETVVYNVTGEGRAISISYVDNDGVMQIEFNVALPWSKEVSLPRSGKNRANVAIVNIGHDVTCSLTVDGVQGRQRTGMGLTVCEAPS